MDDINAAFARLETALTGTDESASALAALAVARMVCKDLRRVADALEKISKTEGR